MLSLLTRRLLSVVLVVVVLTLSADSSPLVVGRVASADERSQQGNTSITLASFCRVVDGQSIDAVIDGKRVAIAVQGIDAPQANTNCGRQAIEAMKTSTRAARASGGLKLVSDPSATLDSRGRRLFYVEDTAGKSIAADLVRAGVARENGKGKLSAQLTQEASTARQNRRGCLWNGGRSGELRWPPTDGYQTASHDLLPHYDSELIQAAAAAAENPQQADADASLRDAIAATNEGRPDPSPESEQLKADIIRADQNQVYAVPAGFQDEAIANGIVDPTAIAFVPDGRLLVATKRGIVFVIKDGAMLSTPFINLQTRVNDYWDHGMLAIAVDPAFVTNGYVYLAYTFENDASDYSGPKTSRVVRVTATGDTASPSSELVILGTQTARSCNDLPAGADCIPTDFFSHSVGALKFAPDGTLFFTHGEGANYNTVHDDALRSQDLSSFAGKLIRMTTTGAGLPDNPFWNGDANANRSKIWAYGLRNPYRFNLKPGTNIPFVGDVGWGAWEEIDVATPGANFGWPCYEGTVRQPGYDAKAVCQTLYGQGASAVKNPLTAYNHEGNGAAVTGGAFYTGTAFPAEYQGAYFFSDYALGFVRTLKVDANNALTSGPTGFGTASNPVALEMAPDGSLYYVAIFTGEIRRIRYGAPAPPPPPPTGTQNLSDLTWTSATNGWGPAEKDRSNGEAGNNDGVTITLNGTTYQKGLGVHAPSEIRYNLAGACSRFMADVGMDDEVGGNGAVVFEVWLDGVKAWDSGTMTGATATKQVGAAAGIDVTGKQQLQLTVTDGGNGNGYDHADWANARVACGSGGNAPPVPTISSPSASLKYKVGDTINFAGSATDPQDGTIAPANLNWEIRLHHCPGGVCHTHQVTQKAAVASGSFLAPDEADDNKIEIVLTVTDAGGLTGTTSVMLLPQTVQITLNTSPAGLQVVYSGTPGNTPMTQTAIVGSQRTIHAPSPQGSNTFASWSDNGAQSHDITVGAANATYTATFTGGTPPTPPSTGSTTYLSDLTWVSATNGWGPVEKNKSNGEAGATDGATITLNGVTYAKGLGTHAASDIRYAVPSGCTRFLSDVGMDDEVGNNGSVVFQVWLDGVKAWESGTMTGATATKQVGSATGLDVTGKLQLRLVVTDNGNGPGYDHGDWADARFTCGGTTPPPGGGTNTPPEPTISVPASTLKYKVGDTIAFAGGATDAQDGTIPATGLSWNVRMHHCPAGVCHTHKLLQQGGIASGSVVAPDEADDNKIELILMATDAAGLTGTTSVMVLPETVQITLNTSPAGLQVTYAGTVGTAPMVQTAIVGSQRPIQAPSPQGSNTFQSWSDNGAQSHNITVGTANATYTATFTGGTTPPPSGTTTYLSDTNWMLATNGWGPVEKNKSNGEAGNGDGSPIKLNGVTYAKGFGVHAPSDIRYSLGGTCTRFIADVGMDDEVGNNGSVVFQVWLDGVKAWDSGVMTGATATKQVGSATGLDVTGKQQIQLIVTDGGNGNGSDHGDWADARVSCGGTAPPPPPPPPPPPVGTRYLSDLTWTSATNGWGPVEKDKSNAEAGNGDGLPITLNGTTYAKGLGTHASSDVRFAIPTGCTRFQSDVGVDDEVGSEGSVVFQVWLDGVMAWDSGTMTGTSATKQAGSATGIDITGKSQLRLVVTDGGNGNGYDHGDWADARLACS